MIDELASRVFATRDAAHREHWAATSYAVHVALGDFYEAVPDAVDALVECYQGQYGPIPPFGVELSPGDVDVIKRMRDDVDWLQATREDVTNGDPSLLNLLDGIVAIYQRTLYKLTQLA